MPEAVARPPARVAAPPVPMLFGPGEALFGVYHPPQTRPARSHAIVFCPPFGHEHLRIHRGLRNIASALARLGFPVLRFDYRGTGDSAGDARDVSLAEWQADVAAAVEEVRLRSQAARTALVGVRLGAALAWHAAAERQDVDLVVAWEPVVNGAAYLAALRDLERRWLADPARAGSAAAHAEPEVILGFGIGAPLERGIAALDLANEPLPPRAHVVALFDGRPAPAEQEWRDRLVGRYGPKSSAVLPTGADWDDPALVHTAAYAQAGLQAIPAMFASIFK